MDKMDDEWAIFAAFRTKIYACGIYGMRLALKKFYNVRSGCTLGKVIKFPN